MAHRKTSGRKSLLQYETHAIHPSHWDPNRLNEILHLSQSKKVLVIGDIGIDRYTIGSVERISPEAPVPIVLVQEEKLKLGLAANVADNIQALGGIPLLVGVVGKDRGGDDFRELLNSVGVESTHLVVDPSRRTVLKERVVSERQQMVRIDYESSHSIDPGVEKKLFKKFKEVLPEVDGVIVEDYAKGMLTRDLMKSLFKLAKEAHKPVAVDPNLKTSVNFYRGATVLTPNTKEAEHLSGILIRDEESLGKAGFQILKASGAKYVVITRGKDGMAIFTHGSSTIRLIPTYAREVYDVSGAGDTVISVMLLSLVSQATIEEACVLGNLAAGVEVAKQGTATVTPDEIRLALEFFQTVSSIQHSS
jgi:rfaE bifunctional protein kinase chain/domain